MTTLGMLRSVAGRHGIVDAPTASSIDAHGLGTGLGDAMPNLAWIRQR